MKKEVSTPVIIAIAVVVVLLLGLLGWKVFGSQGDVQSADSVKAHAAFKRKKEGD